MNTITKQYPEYMKVFNTNRFDVIALPHGDAVIQDHRTHTEVYLQPGDDASTIFTLVHSMEKNKLNYEQADACLDQYFGETS